MAISGSPSDTRTLTKKGLKLFRLPQFLKQQVAQVTPEIAKSFDLSRTKGVLVTQVDEDSAGMEAGLVPGDIIIEAERKQVADAASLNRIMEKSPRNKPILLLVDRDGRTFFITITP